MGFKPLKRHLNRIIRQNKLVKLIPHVSDQNSTKLKRFLFIYIS